jgi:hypothetical protein
VASLVNGFLPEFMTYWTNAWAANPLVFLSLVGAFAFATYQGQHWQRIIHGETRNIWTDTLNGNSAAKPEPPNELQGADKIIFSLRTWERYQKVMRSIKWRIAPAVIVLCALAASVVAIANTIRY